jgi:hypothetical protein
MDGFVPLPERLLKGVGLIFIIGIVPVGTVPAADPVFI